MFTGKFRILIITMLLSFSACFSSYAAGRVSMPFAVEFDNDDNIERICYAGHSGSSVKYKEGWAVLKDTAFTVVTTASDTKADIKKLSADISLIYENEDKTGSYKETVRTYEEGSLEAGEYYQLLSENTLASLEERELLYSDSLQGMVLTLSYDIGGKKKNTYLYVCDDDDYSTYLENAQE